MSVSVVAALVIGGVIFLFGGGLYIIVAQPPFFVAFQEGYIFFTPYELSSQLIFEGMISGFLICLGVLGCYVIHRSQRSLTNPRLAAMLLVTGIALILIGAFGLEALMQIKFS
ncbi:MAG: hypothetical protein QXJ75_03640 [Candidatus Bathyarchaeia archaeon]